MADLSNRLLYGYNFPIKEGISMQYHITTECDQNCDHCYMHNSVSYEQQQLNVLSLDNSLMLVDQFFELLSRYKIKGLIALTGGDPILSPNFWSFLEYCKKYSSRISVSILGNSYHIHRKSAEELQKLGVISYQISIDGLEQTHDSIRSKGSYSDSFRAFEVLRNADILTLAMITVSRRNSSELIQLLKILNSNQFVSFCSFDRMSPIGNGIQLLDEMFTADEYRELLFAVHKSEVFAKKILATKKDNLWKLLYSDLGLVDPFEPSKYSYIVSGCVAGTASISVLSDGTCYACRRLEIPIGKFPEKSLSEIFLENSLTSELRDLSNYQGCASCNLLPYCRGCLATRYALGNSIWDKEPYCWR